MRPNGIFGKLCTLAAAAILLGVPAEAYYHYVFYFRGTPSQPLQAKFDLTRLANSTVVFTVADNGPATYYPNDSFGSVLAEIKQALAAWNSVQTSNLRVSFGGLQPASQFPGSNTPGGEVVFQDLGPGLLGYTTVSMPSNPNLANGFVPISHSQVTLTNNTGVVPGPSYNESFFTTAVHEIGHALGLQHTWTASAMSQGTIRNISRTRPLDADDMAGLSVLYPAANWTSSFGAISGHVNFNTGQAVVLASVVAIPNVGPAVAALTNPDGSFTISGLPPNNYQVYVHPLPPDAIVAGGEGLQLPQYDNGQPIGANGSFRTVFYPGVQDPGQATQFPVNPGSNFSNVNFSVVARSGVPAYNLYTESYLDPNSRTYPANPGASAVAFVTPSPAFIDATQSQAVVAVQGVAPAPTPQAQSVTMLGVGSTYSTLLYNGWLILYFSMQPSSVAGPRHLVFNFGNDIYVLPDGVDLVQKGPPQVTGVSTNGDGTVTVGGNGFSLDSRVYFDGIQASGIYNAVTNNIIVTPPAGSPGQVSTVAVYNSDSQNSLILQYLNPPTYTYFNNANAQIQNITPPFLAAAGSGAPFTAKVDITTTGTQFIDGQVSVGFGSSDVTVSRVWVLSPTHIIASLVIAPGAATGSFEVSVISGMQVISQPGAFQIQPSTGLPQIAAMVNGVTNQPGALYQGNYGVLYGANLGQFGSTQLTINGIPAQILFVSPSQVNFVVPSNLGVGPATMVVTTNSGSGVVEAQIANLAPAITGINGASGGGAVTPGDVLTVFLTGFDNSVAANPSRLQVTVAGIAMPVVQVSNGQVVFVLIQSFGGTQVPVVVSVDGAPSAPFTLTAR